MSPGDIGWASYLDYEGPFWRGRAPYRLPPNPTESDRIVRVITATEGGHFDSFNGYDKCDATLGLIQWCDHGQYSVCDMLGHTAERHADALSPLHAFCDSHGLSFKKNARGRWRFFFNDARGEVDRAAEQDALYHLHSSGQKGTWDAASREYARGMAAALASVYGHVGAQDAQVDFTVERLGWFVASKVKELYSGSPPTPHGRCFRAAFLSYAANNPSWAATYLLRADIGSSSPRYSEGWLVEVLRDLTFSPNVVIYPARYNAIRPVLEQMYGVDLPDFAKELQQWTSDWGAPMQVTEVQTLLVRLGYDIGKSGPSKDGIDGQYGSKCRAAVRVFQQTHGLEPTGYPHPSTRDALRVAVDALTAVMKDASPSGQVDEALRRRVEGLVAASIADLARRAVAEAASRGA